MSCQAADERTTQIVELFVGTCGSKPEMPEHVRQAALALKADEVVFASSLPSSDSKHDFNGDGYWTLETRTGRVGVATWIRGTPDRYMLTCGIEAGDAKANQVAAAFRKLLGLAEPTTDVTDPQTKIRNLTWRSGEEPHQRKITMSYIPVLGGPAEAVMLNVFQEFSTESPQ